MQCSVSVSAVCACLRVRVPACAAQAASCANALWKTSSVGVDGGSRQRSSSDPPAVHPPLPPLRVTSTNPLAPTPPPPVAKTPGVVEALSQQNKPAPAGAPLGKATPPPLPPQPPSRLPQKRPAPGTDKSAPLVSKGQPRGPDALGPLSNAAAMPPPAPMPRKSQTTKLKPKRVKALYNCVADNPDELTFSEGDVIIVDGEEDQEWWIGHIDGDPGRKGAFPVSFVHFIAD